MNLEHPMFREGLAEVLDIDVEELRPEYRIDWDSIAVVTTIAMVDDLFDVVLDGAAINRCETFADLQKLIGGVH